MKRNTLLMILILCIGITVMTTGAFATDPLVTVIGTNILANGNEIILAPGTTANYTVVYHDANNNGVIDGGDSIQTITGATGSADVTGYDLSTFNIYGGKNNEVMTGSTKITMLGGKVSNIYGGGAWFFGVNSNQFTGDTSITINGGEVTSSIIGGGYNGSGTGDTNITINSGTFNVIRGGGTSYILTGNTNITISGGTFNFIFGGGGGTITGNTNITISGGEINTISGSGNHGDESIINGDATIGISGGTIGSISYATTVNGSKNVRISGGSIIFSVSEYTTGKLTKADGITPVYKTSLTLPGITSQTDVSGTLTLDGPADTDYSLNGVKTSNTGLLAFYLPEGAATARYNLVDYTVTVAADHTNAFTPGPQTITFANPGAQNFGTTPTLTATASSLLPVTFTSDTPLVCSITSGGVLTFLSAGTATISANQPGNESYISAPTVSRTFTVNAVVPGAPTGVTATSGNGQATVSFTAPAFTGGAAITGYTVTSSPGGFTGTGAASPITVSGLTNGTSYTFIVTATNSAGTGAASPASSSVTPSAAAPTITSVTVPANGTYTTGQNLNFTVNFSENVNVSGLPYLTINIGGSNVNAEYISGSGSSSLVFRYTISNENDADGITISSPMVHNSGTITGLTSGRALTNWALSNVGSTTGILVDTQAVQATPTFNPGAGVIASGSTVLITSPGADSIFYTTDGTAPTTASTNQATTPLVINGPVTVKAIAVKAGMTNSEIGTAIYTQTVLPSTYTIMEIPNQTLTSVTAGYGSGTQETKNLTITRTGTGDLANLATSISGGSFTITQPGLTTLNDGTPSTTFTVKANDGLAAGTYTETVTVSATNMMDRTFTVTQVVNTVSGGGGSSDDNSPSPEPAPVATILNEITTLDDQKLETSLQLSGEAKIDLNSTGTGQASISGDIINQLSQLQKPLDIAGQGVSLLFGPNALQNPQTNAGNNLGTVEISAVPVGNQEKEELLAATPLGQSTGVFQVGGQIFNFTAQRNTTTDGSTSRENIGNFVEPVAVTIDLSGLNLTSEQISQLTGTRLEKNEMGEIVPVFLGGTYDLDKKTFTFFTEKFSLYTVLQKKDLVILNLSIDNTITKINGEIKNIDVPPSLMNNRTFVPLRYIGEALGASFDWDNESRTVTFQCADQTLDLVVGQNISGMDIGPVIINGRTMVPIRYISENFGAQVMWFPNTRSVSVVK